MDPKRLRIPSQVPEVAAVFVAVIAEVSVVEMLYRLATVVAETRRHSCDHFLAHQGHQNRFKMASRSS